MNTEQILRLHARIHPKMRPIDAVKLLYQNEFGGGHMITNPAKSLEYLLWEAERTPSNEFLPLTVPIGNGLVRVNIAAVTTHRLDFGKLNEIFVESAQQVKGSLESFLEKLDVLRDLTAAGIFAFTTQELRQYLEEYAQLGYPMVSHSHEYRENYAPAYRVVLERLLERNEKVMYISANNGDFECINTESAEKIIAECVRMPENEVWFSFSSDKDTFPVLGIITDSEKASVSYFPADGLESMALGNLGDKQIYAFVDGAYEIIGYHTVSFDKAMQCAMEFWNTGERPSCCEWDDLWE